MRKHYISLLTKFGAIFFVFILLTLLVSGITLYQNQARIDRETRLNHMQQINTYLNSLTTHGGENFLAYQTLMLKYKDELEIPLDIEGYEQAKLDFYSSFFQEYPDSFPGKDISYYDMPEYLQKKYVIYQHEYWLFLFEQARPDLNVIYSYYVVPTGEPGYVYWMIDAFREPSDKVGEQYMLLCDEVLDAPEDGHENMWYALEKGEPSPGYDVYDNEYGRTYAWYRPVIIDGKVRGAIGVEVEIDAVNREIFVSTMPQLISMAVILIIAVIILLYYINRRYISKIEHLSEKVGVYAEKKDVEISSAIEKDVTGNDELSALANQTAAMILELDNYMKNLVATTNELTRTKEQAEKLGQLATRDSLTGVRNKTAYDENVKKLQQTLEAGETEFGIAVVDLNNLKRINDQHGHAQGNLAIQKICRIVCDVFEHSPVFRIGGDEFAIILRGRDYTYIDELVERFGKELKELEADMSLKPWEAVSAAIGFAKYDAALDDEVADVFIRADAAMYKNKKAMKAIRKG